MNKLRERLFVGNYKDASDIEDLKRHGITAVLNVAFEVVDPIYSPKEIFYIKIGLLDSADNKHYRKQLAIDTLILLLEEKETVLIHCSAGVSRSVFIASLALASIEKRDPHDIFEEIRKERSFSQKGGLWIGYEGYTIQDIIGGNDSLTKDFSRYIMEREKREEVNMKMDQIQEQQMRDLRVKQNAGTITPEELTLLSALLELDEDSEDVVVATQGVTVAQAAVDTAQQAVDQSALDALNTAKANLAAAQALASQAAATQAATLTAVQAAQAAVDAAMVAAMPPAPEPTPTA